MTIYDRAAIKAELNENLDKAAALTALATAGDRDPTPEETAAYTAYLDAVGVPSAEGQPATGLNLDLEQAEKYHAIIVQNRRANDGPVAITHVHESHGGEPFALPAAARRNSAGLKVYGPDTSENPVHDAYASGRWIMAARGHRESVEWCEEHGYPVNTMTEGDNAGGGFLVPAEMSMRIIDLRNRHGVFFGNAYIEPMGSDVKTVPRQTSDVVAYAIGETDAYTASDLEHDNVSLVARKWGVLSKLSDELDADAAVNLAERVTLSVGQAIAKKSDQAGFIGDATSTYHGIRGIVDVANDGSHAGALYTTPVASIAFSDLALSDFEGMVGQLGDFADEDGNAAWYISRVGWANSMLNLQNAAGGNTMVDIGRGPERQFMGYPVRFSSILNSVVADQASTAGLCILANLNVSSMVGDRTSGIGFKFLNELYAENGLVGVRATTRWDIKNHSVTDAKDSTGATAGAAVVMKTGAAS